MLCWRDDGIVRYRCTVHTNITGVCIALSRDIVLNGLIFHDLWKWREEGGIGKRRDGRGHVRREGGREEKEGL